MQKTVKQIRQYLKDCFELYSLRIGEFFYDFDDNGMRVETTIFKDGVIDDDILGKMEKVFGISKESILSADKSAQTKWFNKYCYFYHRPRFETAYFKTILGKGASEIHLLKAIFGEKVKDKKYPLRYDYEAVKERMISTLQDIDVVLPGTYHRHATITSLEIESSQFCSYNGFSEMMGSFFRMVETVINYFYKAQRDDLSGEEILEYNFLVTTLGVKDVISPTTYLYYDLVKKLAPVFEAEGYTDFYDYAKFNSNRVFDPWRCREFLTKDYIQAYVNIYPYTKREMFEYAMEVSKFKCRIVWSDAKPIGFSCEDDYIFSDMIPDIPLSKRAKESTTVYVRKTEQELADDGGFAETLIRLTGCETTGGVAVPNRQINRDMSRTISRVEIFMGGKKNG